MRTIAEIKEVITTAFIGNETVISLYELDPAKTFDQQFSKVSIESILFYIVAAVLWTHEAIFEQHKAEVEQLLANLKPHSLAWYRNLALAFRNGYDLLPDSDKYPANAIADANAALVKYAAVSRRGNILYLKVAKGTSGQRDKLTPEELVSFTEYIHRTMDAGVNIIIISREADHLTLTIDVYYNPLVLDGDGKRLDGNGDTPLQDAITNYLQNLPFDGAFSITGLTDALQLVEGVEVPRVTSAQAKWGDYDWQNIVNQYTPEAGWLDIYEPETELNITWHANIQD